MLLRLVVGMARGTMDGPGNGYETSRTLEADQNNDPYEQGKASHHHDHAKRLFRNQTRSTDLAICPSNEDAKN
jgi:hypothetical protein